jgi:integrase
MAAALGLELAEGEHDPVDALGTGAQGGGGVWRHRLVREDQLEALFDLGARDVRTETMFRAAGEAGLREGEVIGLRWPDVDLAARRLHLRRSVWEQRGKKG